jgi:hypothetical protein
MMKILNIMRNYIIRWVGDILIQIPFLKKQHEMDLIENDITNIIKDIKRDLLQLYRYGGLSCENRLMINIQERLDDLYDLPNKPSSDEYYLWIVEEQENDLKFIKRWGKITQQFEDVEVMVSDDILNGRLNYALMVIYERINHRQPLSAFELKKFGE